MRRRLGREIFWLSVPVVLLGGVAVYKTQGGRLPASKLLNSFDNGPRRAEFSPFVPIEMTPLDVYSGYDWGVQTTAWSTGKLNVPSSWKEEKIALYEDQFQLVYRLGKQWKQVRNSALLIVLGDGVVTIKVKLKKVPYNAEEVRLTGQFQRSEVYRGVLPSGWVSSATVRHTGLNHWFTISSTPFDTLIVGKGMTQPAPQISRQQKIEVIEAKWLHDTWGENLLLRVRAKADSGIRGEVKSSVEYFDATGKELKVYQDATSTVPSFPSGSTRNYMNYKMPDSENIVRLAQTTDQPRGGWNKVKMPLTITGIVSDGECWPTPFRVSVARDFGDPKDYGAPPRTTNQ